MIKAVFFDLDGTLVDTIVDLAAAVDKIMENYGVYKSYTLDEYKMMVGHGAKRLIEAALDGVDIEKEGENIMAMFNSIYSKTLFDHSKPYDGTVELITRLKDNGFKLAVISNKPEVNTLQTVNHFFPKGTFNAVAGQKKGVPIKPDPTVVNNTMAFLNVGREEVLYIGDSDTDIKTAKNAGVKSTGVTWGFRSKTVLQDEGADFIADNCDDIMKIIKKLQKGIDF